MIKTIRLFLAVFALLLLAAIPARAAEAAAFFDQSLGDFKVELDDAIKAGKKGVLIMFEAEDCPYCRKMKTQVLNRDDIQGYYRKHFAIFAVDVLGSVTLTDFAGKSHTEKEFANSQRVRGTPTFIFIGPNGKEMARYIGATRDAKEFMELGRYVVEGHWKTMGFGLYYPASGR
jgi:thioredoxin-related protein